MNDIAGKLCSTIPQTCKGGASVGARLLPCETGRVGWETSLKTVCSLPHNASLLWGKVLYLHC